jgi:hypothetical protein
LNGVEDASDALGRLAKGLLAGVEAVALGVAALEVPKRLVDGAGVAASVFCADAPKLNILDAGAVAVAFGVLCAPVLSAPKMLFGLGVSAVLSVFCAFEPKPPNMLVWGAAGSLGASSFCAFVPKPLKILFCAGAAVWVEAPKPLKMPLVAGVLAVFWADELGAPKVNGVEAGAEAAGVFGAPLVVPNRPPEGAALEVPNMPPEGAALDVPNMPPDGAALDVLFCPRPPNGLLCDCELPNNDPPNAGAGAGVLPFAAGAELAVANGFEPPAVKLKPAAEGG